MNPAPPRVLLVDDDASIRRLVALSLDELPIELVNCASVAEARVALHEGPVRLLITDLMMPGETGFDLLEALAAEPALRGQAQLAVFSAGLNAAARQRLQGLGVTRWLDKPVSMAELQACVLECVGVNPAGTDRPPEPPATGSEAPAAPFTPAEVAAMHQHFGADAALFAAFRDSCRLQFAEDLQHGDGAFARRDGPALHLLAHSLKSVLRTLGHAAAAEQAAALDAAASAGDFDAAASAWGAVRAHLEALSAAPFTAPPPAPH